MPHKLIQSFVKASGITVAESHFEQVKNDGKPSAGIYIWMVRKQIVRLGKSESNLFGRAEEHRKNDTWGVMSRFNKLKQFDSLFFRLNFKDTDLKKNRYLLYAFEQYLEDNHSPLLPQNIRKNSPNWNNAKKRIEEFLKTQT